MTNEDGQEMGYVGRRFHGIIILNLNFDLHINKKVHKLDLKVQKLSLF